MARRRMDKSRSVTPPSNPAPYPVFSGSAAAPAAMLSRRERIAEIAAILARGALRHLSRKHGASAPPSAPAS